MKPRCRSSADDRRFPLTDHFYQSSFRNGRFWSPDDGDNESRKFHKFTREFLAESARERATEMAVFALVVIASVWPVIYMMVTVVKLLLKGRA